MPLSWKERAAKLDAAPDRVDLRDWSYQPTLAPLPDTLVNLSRVPMILDQGNEGACTGFALAAVIDYLWASRHKNSRLVSPRMLYELARCYDEWPGEEYEGSSARGAMKGWVAHGVCSEKLWPKNAKGLGQMKPAVAQDALLSPGGAYYRVSHREIRDVHAALAETGMLYVTLMVHKGWNDPGSNHPLTVKVKEGTTQWKLPVIRREVPADSGHAVALVGYTSDGFIVQNSWGPKWGYKGFALLPYEDFLLHVTDCWVAQLGVPVGLDLWKAKEFAETSSGRQRATASVPLADIRPFVVNIGNNGALSRSGRYWTTEEDVQRLFAEAIPNATKHWANPRVLLYLHGGLNSEGDVANRIVAFRDVMLANEVYPIHIMWETGFLETLGDIFADLFTDVDERAGGFRDWMHKFREGLTESKDRSLEFTLAKPGSASWKEMKENARIASGHPDELGGMQLLARYARKAVAQIGRKKAQKWEIHVVAHSAGSIFAAHALPHLLQMGVPLRSMHFMAPAITTELFKDKMLGPIKQGSCPLPSLFILSDKAEQDDNVARAYGKSLLYLVSNAFEKKRETPLLGMARFVAPRGDRVDADLRNLFLQAQPGGLPSLVVAGTSGAAIPSASQSKSHGGFDNDADTMNSVLHRILRAAPEPLFTARDLAY